MQLEREPAPPDNTRRGRGITITITSATTSMGPWWQICSHARTRCAIAPGEDMQLDCACVQPLINDAGAPLSVPTALYTGGTVAPQPHPMAPQCRAGGHSIASTQKRAAHHQNRPELTPPELRRGGGAKGRGHLLLWLGGLLGVGPQHLRFRPRQRSELACFSGDPKSIPRKLRKFEDLAQKYDFDIREISRNPTTHRAVALARPRCCRTAYAHRASGPTLKAPWPRTPPLCPSPPKPP